MRLLLVDGNQLAGRCNGAMKELRTSDGMLSGTVHGFIKSLAYVQKELTIHHSNVVICWDYGRAKARLELYPEYKGGRKWSSGTVLSEEEAAAKAGYYHQLDCLQRNLGHFGYRQVRQEDVEADDLLGIFSYQQSVQEGHHVVIFSGDHDMHQLVSDKVQIFDPKLGLQTKEQILARWEIPDQMPFVIAVLKAMQGDKTDNVPGIPGVGEKTALKMLKAVQHWNDPALPKQQQKLIDMFKEHAETYYRNMQLLQLPRSWTAFPNYPLATRQEAEAAFGWYPPVTTIKMLQFLDDWELEEIKRTL